MLVNRIRVQGMIVFDWKDRYREARRALAALVGDGKLRYRESIVEGLDNAPRGFIALLKGENFGKQLVKLDAYAYAPTSNRPAAPMPPPMHIVTTTCFAPRRLPSISACAARRVPDTP